MSTGDRTGSFSDFISLQMDTPIHKTCSLDIDRASSGIEDDDYHDMHIVKETTGSASIDRVLQHLLHCYRLGPISPSSLPPSLPSLPLFLSSFLSPLSLSPSLMTNGLFLCSTCSQSVLSQPKTQLQSQETVSQGRDFLNMAAKNSKD